VSSKGRGYQLQAYPDGIPSWPQLRKVSVWQTVEALEQEFKERTAQIVQAKIDLGQDAAEAYRIVQTIADDEFERPDSKDSRVDVDQSSKETSSQASAKAEPLSTSSDLQLSAKEETPTDHKSESKTETTPTTLNNAGLSSPSGARLMPISRPHHLPKMDNALQKKMEDIRKTLGPDVSVKFLFILSLFIVVQGCETILEFKW
jgi:hypothetical protein